MKIHRWIISLVFCCCVTFLSAQIRGTEITVVVSPDHTDWKYQLKEECSFTIQVYKAQNLLPGVVIDYELGPEWYPVEKKKGVLLKDGKTSVTGCMYVPSFLRCKVRASVEGHVYEGLATVAYAPEELRPHTSLPADFRQFWDTVLKEARQIPLLPTMELIPERCTDKVNVFHVSFQNICNGSRTFGILCIPKKPGKYPALLRVPGAGVRPYSGDVHMASKGVITLEIGIHGIPVTMSQMIYDVLSKGALNGYPYQNDNSRDKSYYKRVFAGALRAVDFIASLPEYDGKNMGVTGSSQGGALSVVTAALDKRITFYAAIHPAMCDHQAHLKKTAGGWPHYFYYFPQPSKERSTTAAYYDVANFARLITAPGWFSWGYNDEVCPPTSMYAAYNIITAKKELHPYLETGHYLYQEQSDEWNKWLCRQLGL